MELVDILNERKDFLKLKLTKLNKSLKDDTNEIDEDYSEIQKEIVSLQEKREQIGFFKFKEKRTIDDLIIKLQQRTKELQNKKNQLVTEHNRQSERIKGTIKIIDSDIGDKIKFGSAPYSNGTEPLEWIVISKTSKSYKLICNNTVGMKSYYRTTEWLHKDFLEMAFSEEERKMIPKSNGITIPTSSEASTKHGLHVLPTDALRNHIIAEERAYGSRYSYTKLQIENGIKSSLERSEPYWLLSSNTRDGFADYVGSSVDGKRWFAARIGAGADFGVRPVITVDILELTKI